METLGSPSRQPWARFLTLFLSLGVMAGILGALLGILLSQAPSEAGPRRDGMVRLALLCMALLGLTLVAMFWLVVRFLRSRLPEAPPGGRTEHVDAWSLAGKRLKVGEEEGEDPDDEGDEDKGQ